MVNSESANAGEDDVALEAGRRVDNTKQPGTLAEGDVLDVVSSLLRASASFYEDFELDAIPVIAEEIAAPALIQLGAEFLRHYCQGTCLQEGQLRFYRHVDGFYSRLLARVEKHAMQPSLIGQEH